MKRLYTGDVSSTNEMPIKVGTLEFLQDAYKEQFANLFTSLVENPDPTVVYIISGCVNSGSGSTYNISAGVLYFAGEIYNFDGATFTLSGLNLAYARINVTQFTVNADPVTFTDAVARNVHNVRKIVIEATSTASGLPQFKDFVRAKRFFKGETKEIVMDSTEYAIKFVQSGSTAGLGLLEYTGWAETNGNNGTVNDDGRTVIAKGTTFPILEATGGEATHVLTVPEMPSHSHTIPATLHNAAGSGSERTLGGADVTVSNTAVGGGLAHNNMQPYVVRLRIQNIQI